MVQEKLVSSEKTKNDNNVYHEEKFNSPLLKFNNSEEWKSNIKIGDLTEKVIAGATPRTSNNEYWENGTIPWLSSGEIHKKHIEYTDKFITKLGYDNSSTKMIPKHSVLIALAGQGKTRGTVAINNIELCTNQSVASIIPNDTKLYYKYLFYYLENQYDKLRALSSSDGGRGGLNLKLIKSFKINLPSIDEQKKIANFISKIDEKIELLEKKLVLYRKQKNYYLNEIFLVKLLKTNINHLTLKNVCEKIENGFSGQQVPYKTNFPVTRIETMSSGKINYEKVGFVEEIDEKYRLKDGDLLLTNINSLKWIGNVVYFEDKKPLYHGMNLMLLRPKNEFNSRYIYYYIFFHNKWFKKMACQAVNQASINKSTLEKFSVLIPNLEIQNQIGNLMTNIDWKISLAEKEIEKTKLYKKSLLQKMFV